MINIVYNFWLRFDSDGSTPNCTMREPQVGKNSRAIQCKMVVPKSLFQTPQLIAKIEVSDEEKPAISIDVPVVQEAIEQVVGCHVDLTVTEPEKTDG